MNASMPQVMSAPQRAFELPKELEWLNAQPMRLQDLRGRYAALVFFNAASSYCDTVLDQLILFQARHLNVLNCLGLHLPKFDAEIDSSGVLNHLDTLGINFPVANDRAWATWRHYRIKAWPCIVLIDPESQVRGVYTGDQAVEQLERGLSRCLADLPPPSNPKDRSRLLAERPRYAQIRSPAGIAVSERHLYVADTGKHRVLECDHAGNILRIIGSGLRNFADGKADEAAFSLPRNLLLMGEWLLVADSGNHAIRRVNLSSGEVDTLLGDGKPGESIEGAYERAVDVRLNRPWGMALSQDRLYFTQAGANQIWEYWVSQHKLRRVSGSGALGCVDGGAAHAEFAHPSGIAVVQQTAYVVDSTSSALRSVNLLNGQAQTLVGSGLYEFGDEDGPRQSARMQRPTAVVLDDDSPRLWIADTYNSSLRTLKLGGGELKRSDLAHALAGPQALCAFQGQIWIADTAANDILRYDLKSELIDRIPIGE